MNILKRARAIKSNRYLMVLYFILLFVLGFLLTFARHAPKVKLGNELIPCNPKAKINLRKTYILRLWDYDPPLENDKSNYGNYLQKAIIEFQKQYPNIKVEITHLDILNGQAQLTQAIHNNTAPDVYCSLNQIPEFDFKKQIPVGFFLTKEEQEAYCPNILDSVKLYGVQCYFPRWIAPVVWIGNRSLLSQVGLPIEKIQTQGWGWDQVTALLKKIPEGKYLLVGSLGNDGGLFPRTEINMNERVISDGLDLLENLIIKKAAPRDLERNMLGRFINGQSMFLAGVKPVIYRFLKIRLKDAQSNWDPVLLPAPKNYPEENYFVTSGVICVYRNKGTGGDDHIAAAVKLGQFLSNYGIILPWKQMMVIPASKKAAGLWRADFMAQYGEPGIISYLCGKTKLANMEESANFQEKIYPVLQDFCNGKISKEMAKAKILGE